MAHRPQHLALFLDGTWNTEDDSTNILNIYHFAEEGICGDVVQKRYYDRGVGTNMFSSLSGGGFGLGLEKNVREAYNWLIDNYNDGDKIYIFGFSRGAYTARSLVGLIGACGLVKRGAPLTTTQLWNGYTFISGNRSKKYDWWAEKLKKPKHKHHFARITSLVRRNDSKPFCNQTEELVHKWSRRVDITYLGIYDTVGAMGIQALGIQGIKGKLDSHHNLNPSKIIKKCRHALAIDEHRASFRLTPILDYVPNDNPKNTETYKDIIQQRWYSGAHSNIGGGYSNNTLFLKPFHWILDGAEEAGLIVKKQVEPDDKTLKKDIRDSFAELAGNVYPHLIRSKRNYRPIRRSDEVRSGYSLRQINEEIDKSVFEIARADKSYAPPNLLSYLKRYPSDETDDILNDPERVTQQQKWPGEMMSYTGSNNSIMDYIMPRIFLIFWSVCASFGLIQIIQYFWIKPFTPNELLYPIIAGLFVLIDWAEARVTLGTTFYPRAVRLKALWNILYWDRLLGIIAFFTGAICLLVNIIQLGLEADYNITGLFEFGKTLIDIILDHRFFYSIIGAIVLIAIFDLIGNKTAIKDLDENNVTFKKDFFNPSSKKSKGNKGIMYLSIVVGLVLAYFLITETVVSINGAIVIDDISSAFLLISFLLMILYYLFEWVRKPFNESLSEDESIVQLQTAYSQSQIHSLFNSWSSGLIRTWVTTDDEKVISKLNINEIAENDEGKHKALGWLRLREILRHSLWRDILGFIPLYSFIFGVILCIGNTMFLSDDPNLEWLSINSIPFWFALIILTALFDLLENTIHLKHLSNYSKGGSSALLIILGNICSFIKYIGLTIASILSILVIIFLAKQILTGSGNIKWVITIVFIYIAAFKLLMSLIGYINRRLND